MDYFIPVFLTILGVAILVATLKAFLRKDKNRRSEHDNGASFGVGYSYNSRRDDNDGSDSDSGGDGGGGD